MLIVFQLFFGKLEKNLIMQKQRNNSINFIIRLKIEYKSYSRCYSIFQRKRDFFTNLYYQRNHFFQFEFWLGFDNVLIITIGIGNIYCNVWSSKYAFIIYYVYLCYELQYRWLYRCATDIQCELMVPTEII